MLQDNFHYYIYKVVVQHAQYVCSMVAGHQGMKLSFYIHSRATPKHPKEVTFPPTTRGEIATDA
jgi:hypothetical protein